MAKKMMSETKKLKFPLNSHGCIEARKYLESVNLYTPRIERLDGYSMVIYANEVYEQKK